MAEHTTHVVRTRSTHPFALVAFDRGAPEGPYNLRPVVGARIVGYAASNGPKVVARARRLRARVVPIVDGRATVTVTVPAGRVPGSSV